MIPKLFDLAVKCLKNSSTRAYFFVKYDTFDSEWIVEIYHNSRRYVSVNMDIDEAILEVIGKLRGE